MVDGPDKPVSRQRQQSFLSRIAYALFIYPIELFLSTVASVLRPIAPQLIPFAVFFLLVPLLVVPAAISGLYVWYSRAISWETPLFFQYGDGLPPYAETQLTSFNPTQPYDISLHLVVPTTPSNYDLGNFMTTLTLTGPSNRVLTTVRKPAIILPPSSFRWSNPTTTTLKIPLLTRYVSGVSRVSLRVELGRQDGWKSIGSGAGKELSVLTALIEGRLRPQGIRGVVARFPLLSGAVASTAVCLVPALRWQYGDTGATIAPFGSGTRSRALQGALIEKRARKRSLKRSGSVSHVKMEDHEGGVNTFPPTETTPNALRRRRSMISEPVSDND
ncbi:putative adipose-regulatory protein-domain-containing protein [Lactarius psammicola]|nr:putative adipose-regulatory protein-domain-containing protein [Lactarius psammicola]